MSGQGTEKVFRNLNVLFSRAPIVQPPDWTKDFHVFVDASYIAIRSVLLQEYEIKCHI